MEGLVTAHSAGSITINVDTVGGSGTPTSWNINLAGNVGVTGVAGATGATGATGAGFLGTASGVTFITSGSTTLTTQAGLALQAGDWVTFVESGSPSTFMVGQV